MGSQRAGRGSKRFLETVRFILAEFEPKPSHGDPIRGQNYGFGACDMCWNIWNLLFGSNTPSLLLQKLVLEQHSITFGPKACLGATVHNFWSKGLFWSSVPSVLEQKLVLEQHSITFGPNA